MTIIILIFIILFIFIFIKTKNQIIDNFIDNNFKNIPIIINNFNQFFYMKDMIDFLLKSGYKNIIILDNQSTYPKLLDYYKKNDNKKFKVIYLHKNYGHKALWDSGYINKFKNNYFVYTDPDLNISKLPHDFVKDFIDIHKKYGNIKIKIGCSLRIDNLPNHFKNKNEVIKWEKKFWKKPIQSYTKNNKKVVIYKAEVDSTLALYPKNYTNYTVKGLRVSGEYNIEHKPWYFSKNIPDDFKYYLKLKKQNIGHWSSKINN